jgi:hypothetical protein
VSEPGSILAVVPAGDEPVVVLGEERDAALVRAQASVLADRDDDRAVAARPIPHSPLAVLTLAALAAGSPSHDEGQVMAELDAAIATTLSLAWTRGVGGLAEPQPSLRQHLRSWLPWGAGFVVQHHPARGVVPVSGTARPLWPAGSEAIRHELWVSGDAPQRALDWAHAAGGTQTTRRVAAAVDPKQRYGAPGAVEMCAVPTNPGALVRWVSDSSCPVCTRLTPTGTCAFCKRSSSPIALLGGTE